jgi:hypothetical protein
MKICKRGCKYSFSHSLVMLFSARSREREHLTNGPSSCRSNDHNIDNWFSFETVEIFANVRRHVSFNGAISRVIRNILKTYHESVMRKAV